MKRDWNLIRNLLLEIEQKAPEFTLSLTDFSGEQLKNSYHQGVFASNIGVTTSNPTATLGAGTGSVKNIPSQHGVLLTLTMTA